MKAIYLCYVIFLNGMSIEARVQHVPSPEKNKALFKDIIHF